MNKNWPLQLKVTFVIALILSVFGIYQIMDFPKDINDPRLFKRQGLVENVKCEDGKYDYSPKYIYVSGGSFKQFFFKMKGECSSLASLVLDIEITAYGLKPPLNKSGFNTVNVTIPSKELVSLDDRKKDNEALFFLFFILCPMLTFGCLLYGFNTGKWGKNA